MTTTAAPAPAPASRQVEDLDPAGLLTDANIRIDPRLDKDFIASIKAQGVLVPVVAVRTAEGQIRVRYGHRRTLAAAEAGVTVPVLIVADENTSDAATIDRIIGQYAENTQRAGLITSEHLGVVSQLLDLGLTAGQIQRRTRMPKPEVTAAVAVSKSRAATRAAAQYEALTIAQAATLAEFDDDPDAIQALIIAASEGETRFEHAAETLRANRDLRDAENQARAELEAAGVTITGHMSWENQLSYLRDSGGQPLTEETHKDCPGHAAYLRQDWARTEPAGGDSEDQDDEQDDGYRPVYRPVWLCTDPAAHGHQSHPVAASEAARDQRRTVIANNKAWRAAETVRREWLTTLLARKDPPKGALRYALAEIATAHWTLTASISGGHQLAAELLGLTDRHAIAEAITTAAEARAHVITLGLVLGGYEGHTSTETWRTPNESDRRYLTTLTGWGYQLSDVEQLVAGQQQDHAGQQEDADQQS